MLVQVCPHCGTKQYWRPITFACNNVTCHDFAIGTLHPVLKRAVSAPNRTARATKLETANQTGRLSDGKMIF